MLPSTQSTNDRTALAGRLLELWERTGDLALRRLAAGEAPRPDVVLGSEQAYSDWVSTCLMDCYKNSGDPAVFALLFELNQAAFLQAIQSNLRRSYLPVDPQDVLQEVFLNIYRYPHRFHADRADAFRGWGHRIARNTLLKFLKGQSRIAQLRETEDESWQPEDLRQPKPDRAASDAESATVVNCAYLLYLQLYLLHFERLAAKEKLALSMVEIDGVSYRDAAAELNIRLENLKMLIFRSRRKIFRGMERSLQALGASWRGLPVDSKQADGTLLAADRAGSAGARQALRRKRGARVPAAGNATAKRLRRQPGSEGTNSASAVTDGA